MRDRRYDFIVRCAGLYGGDQKIIKYACAHLIKNQKMILFSETHDYVDKLLSSCCVSSEDKLGSFYVET